jgi:endonuclease/exonuclease/phosphatase family metal-dependent hydrolase
MTERRENEARVAEFARFILKKPSYDIICIQEIFHEDTREQLKNSLEAEYPFIVEKSSDHDILNEDSGLFFASRFPILRHTYREFDSHSLLSWDRWVDKGIFIAALDIGSEDETRVFHVYNTHLQSTISEGDTRKKQLTQVRKLVYKALETECSACDPSQLNAVLLGDFNVVGDSCEEYKTMLALLGYPRDLYREKNPRKDGYTWDSKHNKFINFLDKDDTDMQRLDYIFAFNTLPIADDNSKIESIGQIECLSCGLVKLRASQKIGNLPKKIDLSDHYGIEATIEVPFD